MHTLWDYTDTELPCTDSNRSVHMNDMGSMGWELISVSSNPVNESHIYFWKRPVVDGISSALPIDNSRAETELQQAQEVAKEEVEVNDPATLHSHNFIQKISVSNYNKFPKPQIVMIVKYRPKEGCFAVFRDELYKRDYLIVLLDIWASMSRKNLSVSASWKALMLQSIWKVLARAG